MQLSVFRASLWRSHLNAEMQLVSASQENYKRIFCPWITYQKGRQKIFNRGALSLYKRFCHSKNLTKPPLNCSVSYFNWGTWTFIWGISPTKHPRGDGLLQTTEKPMQTVFRICHKSPCQNGNGNGLLFHMTQPISRSTIKAIACSKPTISEH